MVVAMAAPAAPIPSPEIKIGVQHDVGDGSDHISNHGLLAGSLHAEYETGGRGPDDKRRAIRNVQRIPPRKGVGLGIGTEQS